MKSAMSVFSFARYKRVHEVICWVSHLVPPWAMGPGNVLSVSASPTAVE